MQGGGHCRHQAPGLFLRFQLRGHLQQLQLRDLRLLRRPETGENHGKIMTGDPFTQSDTKKAAVYVVDARAAVPRRPSGGGFAPISPASDGDAARRTRAGAPGIGPWLPPWPASRRCSPCGASIARAPRSPLR